MEAKGIEGQTILLGRLFRDVCQNTNGNLDSSRWPTYQVACSEVFDICCFSSRVTAPFHDRPIVQQTFDLKSEGQKLLFSSDQGYITQISRFLGVPRKTTTQRTTRFSEIRTLAEWQYKEILVTLSVFGSDRDNGGVKSFGSLFCDAMNEVELAQPFLQQNIEEEKLHWSDLKDFREIYRASFQKPIAPFARVDPRFVVQKTEPNQRLLRLSQKSLYNRRLLETPKAVSDDLKGKEVLLWSSGKHDYVSTKFDTVVLVPSSNFPFAACNLLPAKGPGCMSVDIDELSLVDRHSSPAISGLIKELEKALCRSLVVETEYDY